MVKPKPLFPGARVALVAPSSAVPEEKLQPALELVQSLGMEPVPYPSCYYVNRDGYFAAKDAQRAADITDAFADDTIDGVWCIRGGYGAHRLVPLLDLDIIRNNRNTSDGNGAHSSYLLTEKQLDDNIKAFVTLYVYVTGMCLDEIKVKYDI